ncbi:MAG TPA: hypothetical protein VMU95_11490 [Trebonia sp.]|nr:hypothetical protein [Trebonia sp.]
MPAAADWNNEAASTPVNARVTAFSRVTTPTVGCSAVPSPATRNSGKARLTASRDRSRSSLSTSRWAIAAIPPSW